MKAKLLVFFQFSGILLVLFGGNILPLHIIWMAISACGIILGLWAIAEQGIGNFNISPTNKSGSKLIASGPYRMIRHPMYMAILITLLPIVIAHFTYFRLISVIILTIVLLIKLEYEEKQLRKHFNKYPDYQKRTSKLIPFIY